MTKFNQKHQGVANVLTIVDGKLEPDPRYWALAFTGHTNIEKCYGEKQLPNGFGYNTECVGGIGTDSANKLYTQIKKAIIKFIDSNIEVNGCTVEEVEYPDGLNGVKFVPGEVKLNKLPCIIIGMARGVDEIAGLVAMDMGLPLICCVPHSIEWHRYREPSKGKGYVQAMYYNRFLGYKRVLWYEIRKTYSTGWPFANFARNAAMVDLADKVISFKCYDSAGTDHCIKLAKKAGKYAGNISKE